MKTDNAETYIKFGHNVIYSLIMIFVTKISYLYFRDSKDYEYSAKGQLIAFILLSNPGDRIFYSLMYNDEIMALYMIICIYFAISN
jgi:hypothetical protein